MVDTRGRSCSNIVTSRAATVGNDAPSAIAIVNPASASGRTRTRWEGIVAQLRAQGLTIEPRVTEAAGHASEIARSFAEAGGRDIVILGGDGTVGETVAGLVRADGAEMTASGVTISIIHQGTGGDFVRGLGIPRDTEAAVRVAASGSVREVDVPVATFQSPTGDTTIRGFANLANIGMGADVVHEVTGTLKRLGNSGAFLVSALHQLARNRPRPIHVVGTGHDGHLEIVDVMVANNRFMGGGMLPAPEALLDDGALDVVMITATGRLRLARKMPKLYKGTHLSDPITRWFRSEEVRIDTPRGEPQGVVLDGELVGTTPVAFRVIPRALGVRVP
jgi:diacylglycerol kinase (ATP)